MGVFFYLKKKMTIINLKCLKKGEKGKWRIVLWYRWVRGKGWKRGRELAKATWRGTLHRRAGASIPDPRSSPSTRSSNGSGLELTPTSTVAVASPTASPSHSRKSTTTNQPSEKSMHCRSFRVLQTSSFCTSSSGAKTRTPCSSSSTSGRTWPPSSLKPARKAVEVSPPGRSSDGWSRFCVGWTRVTETWSCIEIWSLVISWFPIMASSSWQILGR